jgi:hypothetical protein
MIFPIFIVIFFLFANLLVPLFLYHRRHGLFQRRYKGKGGCNGWSFVMAGIAAGMVNFVVARYLLEIKAPMQNYNVMMALIIGFLIMVLAHIWMSYRKWEIWITPKPWKWNEGGYWHMISMTLQTAFLVYPFVLLMQEEVSIVIKKYLWFGVFGVLLFLWSFKRSERDLKIGRFILSSEAW